MSFEGTHDAWNGRIWEQEQPIGCLLTEDLFPSTTEVIESPFHTQDTHGDRHDEPTDSASAVPMYTDEDEAIYIEQQPKVTGKATGILKKNTTGGKSRMSPGLRKLQKMEREMRRTLIREEGFLYEHMGYHRVDDKEFWQLLERQRKRREARALRVIQREEMSKQIRIAVPNPPVMPPAPIP